jgi:hypothetical protein
VGAIRQRISLRCQTTPLTLEEAHGYVQKRVRIAGGIGRNVFAPEAIHSIYLYSRGIPRVVNLLCEHAMVRAYVEQIQTVPVGLVDEAAKQLQIDDVKTANRWLNVTAYASAPGAVGRLLARENEIEAAAQFAEEREPVRVIAPLVQQNMGREPNERPAAQRLNTPCEPPARSAEFSGSYTKRQSAPSLIAEIGSTAASNADLDVERAIEEASRISCGPGPHSPHVAMLTRAGKKVESRPFLDFPTLQEEILKTWNLASEIPASFGPLIRSIEWKTVLAWAKWPAWQRHVLYAVRWLQQPLPAMKLHHRADH